MVRKALQSLPLELTRASALLLAFVCAAAAVGGHAGRFSELLDAATHFAPGWLAGSVAAALVWRMAGPREMKATPLLAAVGAVASILLMVPELAGAAFTRHSPPAAETIKVVQMNVWARNRERKLTADWLIAQKADVLLLEEAGDPELMAALKGAYPVQLTCTHPYPCEPMILAKRAPLAHGGYTNRARSNITWARFAGKRGPFSVMAIHHSWPLPAGPQQQQSAWLERTTDRFAKDSLILAGDFNATPWSFSLRRQDKALGLKRLTRAMPTWPARKITRLHISFPFALLPIDHVYAGRDWRAVKVERGPRLGSDHYPVAVTLTRD